MGNQSKTILLIGYDEHLCLSIAYALRKSKHRLILLTHRPKSVCRYSRYISKVYTYQGYEYLLDKVEAISKIEKLDLIMPFDELESLFVSRRRAEFARFAPVVPLTDAVVFEKAINKNELNHYLVERGLDIMPKAIDLSESVNYEKAYELQFPVLIKPSRSSFGRGIETVETKEDLQFFLEKHPEGLVGFSAQEFITGSDVTCNIYAKEGEIQMHTIQESPLKTIGNYAKNDDLIFKEDTIVYELVASMARILKWNGIACVDLRRDAKSGSVYLLEINGRYWGSVSSSLDRAHVNFPELMIHDTLQLEAKPINKKAGIQISTGKFLQELKRLHFGAIWDTKYKSYLYDPLARVLKYLPH